MKKEEIITVIIIILVIAGEIITQKHTSMSLDELDFKLGELKTKALSKEHSNEELKQSTKEIDEFWQSKDDMLSFYLEHEELEKIKTQLKTIQADFEADLEEEVVPEIEKGMYIIEHLKDKQKLNWKNVF